MVKNIVIQKSTLKWLLPPLGLLLLILIFLNKLAFSNLILARGDTFLYFYPYWHAAADALSSWRIPLWNPAIFMGAPLFANSQMGFFYPLNWPLWLLLDTPYAVNAAILLHLFIAACGTYLAGRQVMKLDRTAAFVAALAFALGGYLTAQVEHVNQLQGLAWLPWLLWVVGRSQPQTWRGWLKSSAAIAILFSLQLLAGHTQTTFISGIALLVWILVQSTASHQLYKQESSGDLETPGKLLLTLSILFAGGILSLLLSAVQLLPTLELTGLSSRQGGLPVNEVLSFSLNPLLLTRALLPSYEQSIFSEYASFLPLTFLALAFIGAWQWRKHPAVVAALVWIIIALLLALGAFNPLNWILAQLPGFNLFRAPARWLVIYSLGMALLAGAGWQTLLDSISIRRAAIEESSGQKLLPKAVSQPLIAFLLFLVLLALWGFLAGYLLPLIPAGPEAPFEAPSQLTLFYWVLEALFLILLLLLLFRWDRQDGAWLIFASLLGVALLALFLATRTLPYNNLTTPEAYFDLRPTTTRLMVETAETAQRFLSLSDIFFDPGDQAEIDSIYENQLTESAQYDYTIAVKQKEILSPNLPMLVGLASIDGFDGGVLPLQSYTEQMKLILPDGVETTDGRLREHLDQVPEARWLDLFNARYLITDKVGDIWLDGVFFDRQHPLPIAPGSEAKIGYLPDFEATELRLLSSHQPGAVHITTSEDQIWEIQPQPLEQGQYQVPFPTPATAAQIGVGACSESEDCELLAITLVDERDQAFQPLVPGNYRMIHSGDVKIYENLDVLPRAFLVSSWQWVEENTDALDMMKSPQFNPREDVLLVLNESDPPVPTSSTPSSPGDTVSIDQYLPEQVHITANSGQDAMLILTDAYYPGWQVTIDDQPGEIFLANMNLRAVHLPAGAHDIIFSFTPRSFTVGLWLSLASLAILSIILTSLLLSRKNHNA